jgi:hypothetical protein
VHSRCFTHSCSGRIGRHTIFPKHRPRPGANVRDDGVGTALFFVRSLHLVSIVLAAILVWSGSREVANPGADIRDDKTMDEPDVSTRLAVLLLDVGSRGRDGGLIMGLSNQHLAESDML